MKKALLILFAAIAAMLTFGCKGNTSYNPAVAQANFTPEEAKTFLESGDFTFIVGFDSGFAPYGSVDQEGNMVGFDLDLAREVATRRGWKLVLRPINWNDKDAELEKGSVSCLWNGFTINGREEQYTWTEPYLDTTQVFIVLRESKITSRAKLAGKVIEVQADSRGARALNDDSEKAFRESLARIVEVPNFDQAYQHLLSEFCDAVVIDYTVAVRMLISSDACIILDEILDSENIGVGFKKGNTVLRDMVQETLREMMADGTFSSISRKWFNGDNMSPIKM